MNDPTEILDMIKTDAVEAIHKAKEALPLVPGCAYSEPIHDWFSLSYASYLVIPRTILQSCTPENQQRLVDALDAIYEECSANMENQWPHEATIDVRLKDCVTGRFVKDDLADYRRGRRRLWHNPKPSDDPSRSDRR